MLRVNLTGLAANMEKRSRQFEEAARPAAQAAAQVFYVEVKKNVSAIGRKTGNLERSIYQVYSVKASAPGKANYAVSWNAQKAPHGGLVEYGHIQRYVVRMGKDGRFYTARRPGMSGVRKPRRNASQAEKDAYYLPLPAPKQVAAKPFLRPAMDRAPEALAAAKIVLLKVLNEH
jgi:hypothetical protein